ncbi:DUF5713 family protein [Nocardiopsis sp. N85]|uniref:DUF5713 family protein n=1 Tax=Nocardiopsis sp. N85 TaxID=3029400 RepID=UPI00237F8A40|nr:DUF5713 family protein [Nocardiopsis sp. N85]MDE3723803.1 DUF5713 family protein [Nocardiopsis sp. N85]
MPTTEPAYLAGMYRDAYFPDHLVDKGRAILVALRERIETERPADLPALHVLTNAAVEEFNALQEEFWAADSEIETVARDDIALSFEYVMAACGFADADLEEALAERDW